MAKVTGVEVATTAGRRVMMKNTGKRVLGVREAKRWLKAGMIGYYAVRSMVLNNEISNKHWESTFKRDFEGWVHVHFIYVGNHTLVIDYTNFCLQWQE